MQRNGVAVDVIRAVDDFTNRNTAFLTWNLLHVARMLKDRGGIPAHGNQRRSRTRAVTSAIPTRSTAPGHSQPALRIRA